MLFMAECVNYTWKGCCIRCVRRKKNEGFHSIEFLCPEILSKMEDNQGHNIEVMKYVETSLLRMKGIYIVLMPFCQEEHWRLVILCPAIQEGFICDPEAN